MDTVQQSSGNYSDDLTQRLGVDIQQQYIAISRRHYIKYRREYGIAIDLRTICHFNSIFCQESTMVCIDLYSTWRVEFPHQSCLGQLHMNVAQKLNGAYIVYEF